MATPQYNPVISVQKGATDGTVAGTVATLLGFIMLATRSNNPDLPWGAEADPALVGAATAAVTGVFKWVRNRAKHKGN